MIVDQYIGREEPESGDWYAYEVTDCDTVPIAGPFKTAREAQQALNDWLACYGSN